MAKCCMILVLTLEVTHSSIAIRNVPAGGAGLDDQKNFIAFGGVGGFAGAGAGAGGGNGALGSIGGELGGATALGDSTVLGSLGGLGGATRGLGGGIGGVGSGICGAVGCESGDCADSGAVSLLHP